MWKTILGHGIRSKKRPTSRHVITRFYKSGIKSHRGPPCQQYLPLWKSGFEVKTVSALNLPILRPLDSLPHLFCQFLALNNANYFSFFFFLCLSPDCQIRLEEILKLRQSVLLQIQDSQPPLNTLYGFCPVSSLACPPQQ